MGVRYRSYKWVGHQPQKLFKFVNNSHVELPCNEVQGEEFNEVHFQMLNAAYNWWQDVLDSPNSFVKPTSYLVRAGHQARLSLPGT